MKKKMISAVTILFALTPFVANSATIQGQVNKSGGEGVIKYANVNLLNANGDWLDGNPMASVDNTGNYSFEVADAGSYQVQISPYTPSPDDGEVFRDQAYIPTQLLVDNLLIDETRTVDFTLNLGGNISGTITDEGDELVNGSPVSNNIYLDVYDSNFNLVGGGWVDWDNGGVFTTQAVPAGSYRLKFVDSNEPHVYADQLYEIIPGHIDDLKWRAPEILVNENQTTGGINMTVHKTVDSSKRYFHYGAWIGTTYDSNNAGDLTVKSGAVESLYRFSDNTPISLEEIESFTVLAPTPENNCTQWSPYIETTFQWRAKNRNGDMLLDQPDEAPYNASFYETGVSCNTIGAIHEAGTYTVQTTFKNSSQQFSETQTREAGLSAAALPPLSNLVVTWDNTAKTLNLSWTRPDYDPNNLGTNAGQIRIYCYNEGQYLNKRLRVDNLPFQLEGNTAFTLGPDMTVPIDVPGIDQLLVEVRVVGINRTATRHRQGFDFDYEITGGLTPAEIGYVYDINGDGKTGLAEAIKSLQNVTSP